MGKNHKDLEVLLTFKRKEAGITQAVLAEDLEVLGAAIKNGLLTVNLERVVPDHKKPRVIEVK